jgi:hypothetical protein
MPTREQQLKKAIEEVKDRIVKGAESGEIYGVLQAQIDAVVKFLTTPARKPRRK